MTRRLFALLAAAAALSPVVGAPQQTGASMYAGYAYPECGAADAPAVHVVLLPGAAAPATMPARPPRPAIELLFNTDRHPIAAQPSTFRVDSPKGPVAMMCPVIGSCSVAESGEVSIYCRSGDAALAGEFRIVWPGDPARTSATVRQFVAAWRDAPTKCR